ncbi:hypothetical protein [Deinococcus sonorensis]|uniref:Uncharacterized protein n=1 Tax=Deinococcus sonorensis TaxID=309891 RepID=A0ABV8YAZ2_9DEIO
MREGYASATIQRVFPITGRGVALELAELEGVIQTGDWLVISAGPHER